MQNVEQAALHQAGAQSISAASPQLLFREVTSSSGVEFAYSNGRSAGEFAILESLGGGLGMLDFDLDGRVDVMFAGGGRLDNKTITSRPCGFFQNLAEWKFREVTLQTHTSAQAFFTHGVFPADFNGDGFDDVAVSGYGGVQLLVNMGDGTFDALEPLITNAENAWSSSLAWADLDENGHLDLYVAHYVNWSWRNHPRCAGQAGVEREVCAPGEFKGLQDVVYFNDGCFPFRKESESIGLVSGGKGLGVVVGDLNMDGHVDLYVGNDTTDNHLYLNQGGGRFSESALLAGVSGDDAGVSTGSMGVLIFDATGDELPDIFVTNFDRELSALYRNDGGGYFTYASRQAGFAAYESGFVGFGTVSLDFNFDGALDIVVANGHVTYASPYAPYRQLPFVFQNDGGRQFRRLDLAGYFAEPHTGRGLATADLDNDGAVDLAFSNLEEPVALLAAASPSNTTRWASVNLIGKDSNRNAIGATLSTMADGKSMTRFLCGGGGYLSSSDRRQHFYWIDDSQHLKLTVRWPKGTRESFVVEPFREKILIEGSGQALTDK